MRQSIHRQHNHPLMVLLALLLLMGGCGKKRPEMPASLGGMAMTGEATGDAARSAVDSLHGKGIAPGENLIRTYAGNGGSATLYVSWYGDRAAASREFDRMARRIKEGSPVFTRVMDRTIRDQAAVTCEGLGQGHLFFARGEGVYWLAVDPQSAAGAADDLIRWLRP